MCAQIVQGGESQSAFLVAASVGFGVGVQIQVVLEHCGKTEAFVARLAVVFEVFSEGV